MAKYIHCNSKKAQDIGTAAAYSHFSWLAVSDLGLVDPLRTIDAITKLAFCANSQMEVDRSPMVKLYYYSYTVLGKIEKYKRILNILLFVSMPLKIACLLTNKEHICE